MNFAPGVIAALGESRCISLRVLNERLADLHALSADASTTEILLTPMSRVAAQRWEALGRTRHEDWVFLESSDRATVYAVDEPSEAGSVQWVEAVIYPELHTRFVSWWLCHAWRTADLLEDTLENISRWRITSAAVTARALIEDVGCLLYESRKLASAWKVGKTSAEDPVKRAEVVRNALHPVLTQAGFGSRMKGSDPRLQAINVCTYVDKLAQASGQGLFKLWYDWLSDAAHPAFGSRIGFSSEPVVHDSGALTQRYYARAPLVLQRGNSHTPLAYLIAQQAAATLTRRTYWRNHVPVSGSRPCPYGRGKWSRCGHRWGQPAPEITLANMTPTNRSPNIEPEPSG